jgi:hypothetical protein
VIALFECGQDLRFGISFFLLCVGATTVTVLPDLSTKPGLHTRYHQPSGATPAQSPLPTQFPYLPVTQTPKLKKIPFMHRKNRRLGAQLRWDPLRSDWNKQTVTQPVPPGSLQALVKAKQTSFMSLRLEDKCAPITYV